MHNCQNLNTDQRHHILKLLRTKWPPTDDTWWHPLDACRAPEALHVETAWFETQVSLDVLRMRLADAGYAVIWQLFEGTPHWDDDPPPDVRKNSGRSGKRINGRAPCTCVRTESNRQVADTRESSDSRATGDSARCNGITRPPPTRMTSCIG